MLFHGSFNWHFTQLHTLNGSVYINANICSYSPTLRGKMLVHHHGYYYYYTVL